MIFTLKNSATQNIFFFGKLHSSYVKVHTRKYYKENLLSFLLVPLPPLRTGSTCLNIYYYFLYVLALHYTEVIRTSAASSLSSSSSSGREKFPSVMSHTSAASRCAPVMGTRLQASTTFPQLKTPPSSSFSSSSSPISYKRSLALGTGSPSYNKESRITSMSIGERDVF